MLRSKLIKINCFLWILPTLVLPLLISACAGPSHVASAPGSESDPGRRIYVTRCAKCHKFYSPASYSDQEWAKWMKKMQKKAKLTDEQEALLASYINTNLRSGKTP